MDSLRKSPVARAISWLLTVAMVFPLLMLGQKAAHAQTQQAITVIVADFINVRTKSTDALAIQARDAVYNELQATGQGRFNPIPEKELRNEAKLIGIRVPSSPSTPANFTQPDLARLAKALHADGIVTGEVNVAVNKKNVASSIAINVNVQDSATGSPINGSVQLSKITLRPGEATEEAITRTVADTGLNVVRDMVARQTVTGTVLNVNVDTIIINRGTRDGLHVGDELLVLQYQPDGSFAAKGRVKVARAYATDSECEATQNNGISPENIVRALYRPSFVVDIRNLEVDNRTSSRVNFSSIGRTLSVLGLGVLIAVAIKGGQTSVTNVTAEPNSESNSPVVRVRFGDNIFGQGGVLQYKIYRDPDFPYSSPGSGSNNNGNGNGGNNGGTNGTVTIGLPIGTAASTLREFTDHASPNYPFLTGSFLIATSNGGNNTGGTSTGGSNGGGTGGGNGGNNNSSGGCGTGTSTIDTGFTPGRTYTYFVTAIILRQVVTLDSGGGSSGGTGGLGGGGAGGSIGGNTGGGTGNGGNTGGNGGNGNGNGNTSSNQCIETDPVRSGPATPVTPVLITSPTNGSSSVDIYNFAPSFGSRAGADLFQIEVSTDRLFKNPKLIYTHQLLSTSPTQDNVAQTLATPIDLSTAPALLANSTFSSFVGNSSTTTATLPTLYFRVGARHDSDVPGPVNAISLNASDNDRTFRFVYSQVYSFTPVPIPPKNPGKAVAANSAGKTLAQKLNSGTTTNPLNGTTARTLTTPHTAQTPQDILTGRTRIRH